MSSFFAIKLDDRFVREPLRQRRSVRRAMPVPARRDAILAQQIVKSVRRDSEDARRPDVIAIGSIQRFRGQLRALPHPSLCRREQQKILFVSAIQSSSGRSRGVSRPVFEVLTLRHIEPHKRARTIIGNIQIVRSTRPFARAIPLPSSRSPRIVRSRLSFRSRTRTHLEGNTLSAATRALAGYRREAAYFAKLSKHLLESCRLARIYPPAKARVAAR